MTGLTGIVPILLTPFHEDQSIDYQSLEREVGATIDAGVHGLGLAIGSEVFKLTSKERRELLKAVADQVAGEVPLIMNTSAPGTEVAVRLSVAAAEAGATRLMIWPPDFFPTGADSIVAHLSSIAKATGLPIVLQDVPQSPIPTSLALRIAEDVPLVDTIKVETQPTVEQVAAMAQAVDGRLSVLGGAGGGTFVEEYRRGARGTMPFASQSKDFMAAWNALERGDETAAEQIVESRVLPVNRLGFQGGDLFYHVHKARLVEDAVFKTATVRDPTCRPDRITREEIGRLMARMH